MARPIMIEKATLEELMKLDVSLIGSDGKEYPNPKGLTVDVDPDRPDNLREQIRRIVRTEVARAAVQSGYESFEEANDFEVDEDPEFKSAYEFQDMVDEEPMKPVKAPVEGEVPARAGSSPEPEKTEGESA